MIATLDASGRDLSAASITFKLQIGHALVSGKPIVLTVPHGVPIPPKLEAAATAVARYNASDPESLTAALLPVPRGTVYPQ